MRVSSTPLLPALLQLYVAGCVRRSVAQRPLFTGVRGRKILRSSLAGSCIAPSLRGAGSHFISW